MATTPSGDFNRTWRVCYIMSETSRAGEAGSSTDSSDKDSSVECGDCGRVYSNRQTRTQHWKLDNDCTGNFECPTCGETHFKNEYGMKIHHEQVHGESIAGVLTDCEWCGSEVRKRKQEYEKYEHSFCSMECRHKWQSDFMSGDDNPTFKGGKIEVECWTCGEVVKRYPSLVTESGNVFCQDECFNEYMSENMSGENSPRWKGGVNEYGSSWYGQRKKAIERDDRQCSICGKEGPRLEVHHIIPLREFDDTETANELSNLITLCSKHHHEWEGLYLRPDIR